MNLARPLTAKSADGILRVIAPARISTPHQDVESMSSVHFDDELFLRENYVGAFEITRLSEQASGWVVDRPTMLEVESLIASGKYDLVLVSEMREIYRNPASFWKFIFKCVDANVRFISTFDGIDTGADDWEINSYVASLRHGMTVPETRKRVRRKATHAFSKGGMVLKIPYGYRKLTKEEAASGEFGTPGLRITKLSECTPSIREMRRRLLHGNSPDTVAEWCIAEGILPGPYVKGGWTGKLIMSLFKNRLLSGVRRFRVIIHQQVYATGKHRRVQNQTNSLHTGVQKQDWPELAHITPEEQDEVLACLKKRKKGNSNPQGAAHPRWNCPRSRALWPQQHARCGVCGGLMYASGAYLKCQNTLSHSSKSCWNHVQVNTAVARERVLNWILGILDSQPRFREVLIESAWREHQIQVQNKGRAHGGLRRRIEASTKEIRNLTRAIRQTDHPIESLVEELAKADKQLAADRKELARLERQNQQSTWMTREQLAAEIPKAIRQLIQTSFEFGNVLRRFMPEFVIRPVQALNCPFVRPRAYITLRWEDSGAIHEKSTKYTTSIDLFEIPLHMRYVRECSDFMKQKMTKDEIAAKLGITKMAVYRNLSYHQLMEKNGMECTHRELFEPPSNASRWHKHRSDKTDKN